MSQTITFKDCHGEEVTVARSSILYLRATTIPKAHRFSEAIQGQEALQIILDDPMGRDLWVIEQRERVLGFFTRG